MLPVGITLQGDLRQIMAEETEDAAAAVTRGIGSATDGLKDELRQQVVGAGLGQRLANTWRGDKYPSRSGVTSLRAAGLVYSNAPDIAHAFNSGTPIRSKDGFFLAIPTAAAGARGMRRDGTGREKITPGGWERRTGLRLRFVYRRGAPSLLVADNVRIGRTGLAKPNTVTRKGNKATRLTGRTTTVIFVLVPQVSLRKRLDIDGAVQRWTSRLPELIVNSWPERKR